MLSIPRGAMDFGLEPHADLFKSQGVQAVTVLDQGGGHLLALLQCLLQLSEEGPTRRPRWIFKHRAVRPMMFAECSGHPQLHTTAMCVW